MTDYNDNEKRRTTTGEKQYCSHCKRVTEITYIQVGIHVQNICPDCNLRRLGKPFITKKKLNKIIKNLPGINGVSELCIHSEK